MITPSKKIEMSNAHVILIDESSDKSKDNTLLKRITSGTEVPFRELQTNGGTIKVLASVVYFSNQDVDMSNIDTGTLRRLHEYTSPEESISIEWNSGKFTDIFLNEKEGIIMDFFNAMKKFVEKPKNNKAQKQRVATSIFDIFFKEKF